MMDVSVLPPWEQLLKRMVWEQLGDIQGANILDFGSGEGWTAAYLSRYNSVTAIEPSQELLSRRKDGPYRQLHGSLDALAQLPDHAFDLVVCHNVLEYIKDKEGTLKALMRVLKPGGRLSLVKHHRPGRVMQMAVLLDDFQHAHQLLDGGDGRSGQFGAIRYYCDDDVVRWAPELRLLKLWGLRTFWDLQQNQEKHCDPAWQDEMLKLEMRVSVLSEYQAVAFFHHMIYKKET